MKLNTQTVHSLINELSSVIDYNLNIMDEEGVIISSTDAGRIGQFHEAARLIISQHLPSLLVRYDNEYKGCKEGTNVPLLVDDEIIGVIGITGDVYETSKYANIIKKTAEILLKDYAALSESTRLNEARMFFLNSWVNGEVTDVSRIRRKLEQYGYKSSQTFQAAIVDSINGHDDARSFLRERIRNLNTITTWNNSCGIIIGMFPTTADLVSYLEEVMSSIPNKDDYFFAVGNTVKGEENLRQSYNHAFSLYQYVKHHSHALGLKYSGICLYEDHTLDVVMDYIPNQKKKEYSLSIFRNLNKDNIIDTVSFILTYCECNGSINGVAEKLFIHKNTVQYKIKRIKESTGLDLRVSRDMIKLYAAAEWYLLSLE